MYVCPQTLFALILGQRLPAQEEDLILYNRSTEYLLCTRLPAFGDTKINKTCGQLESEREISLLLGHDNFSGFYYNCTTSSCH